MLKLTLFVNCEENDSFIPKSIVKLLKSYNLTPRYVYSNESLSKMLIQAGGCAGIDSALITVIDLNIYTIEFKEPGAKTSEPDLPKYGEDGILRITKKFLDNYPQFEQMLNEQKGLNFFEAAGNNVHNFSKESVNIAATNNYTKKYADVVCTEDNNGYLVMLPINQISVWAQIEGEIRPTGRNPYRVWTPEALKRILEEKGAVIKDGIVTVKCSALGVRKARGGNGKITGYKISPLFFVRTGDCALLGDNVIFALNDTYQLNPTIAGKMFFENLKHHEVKKFYF